MHKDTTTRPAQKGIVSSHRTVGSRARQPRYDPQAAGKGGAAGWQRTVLVTGVSADANDVGAACAAMLAGAGHRVVALTADGSAPGVLEQDIAAGRVIILPDAAGEGPGLQKAVKELAAPFRSIDAVATIMRVPRRRLALLDADLPIAQLRPLADVSGLLETTRATIDALVASKRGHIIAVTLSEQHDKGIADNAYLDALCNTLRMELDELGIRFTRIAAGPVQRKPGPSFDAGIRPRSNGMRHGLLSAADVAQALAWALGQPGHAAVRDIGIGPAPRCQPVLSLREREVLEWTACGKTSEEISRILELSVSAVNFHVKNLLCKLQCCNKTAAVARAALLGMLI